MFAEISASIALNSNCTINAKIFDTVECSDVSKVIQMRNALKTLVQGDMVISPVQTFPKGKKGGESDALISLKQIGTLKNLFRENNIKEADFCSQHSVESLEKMPKEEARQAIGELIELSKNKH